MVPKPFESVRLARDAPTIYLAGCKRTYILAKKYWKISGDSMARGSEKAPGVA
jgi:hypothetical protein